MKSEFSQRISEKYANIKFHENRPVWAELSHADGRRHDEANGHFFAFY